VVKAKKPDPAIYLLALEKTGLRAGECLVFEDSHIGAVAAKAAGMHVVATTNPYTETEDLSMADLVVNCLGDPHGEHAVLRPGRRSVPVADGCVHARDLLALFDNED
jgi:beta-phosphoglucomutase-like phosphatase (HAD superfamily)